MLELYPPETLLIVASKDPSVPETGLNAALADFDLTPLPRNFFDDSEVAKLFETLHITFAPLSASLSSTSPSLF